MLRNLIVVLFVALLSYGAVKFVAVFREDKLLEPTTTTIETNNYAPIVQLNSGKVRGRVLEMENDGKINFYEGIKFGQANRFEKATPVNPWTDIYDATTSRSSCPQPRLGNHFEKLAQSEHQSEDCLYLNVWKPADDPTRKRSVMFFIHGGAFLVGTIFCPFVDARHIASRGDVIVVAVNYRLGAFGFLHGGDLVDNLGLHDQILGLKWVQQNIGQFGGDPADVTIFGPSAGSVSVGALVLSPLTKGLFKRAILMAGAPNSANAFSKATSLEQTKKLASKLNCPTDEIQKAVKCIRTKTTNEILDKTPLDIQQNQYYVPVYGDEVLPVPPVKALKSGQFNSVDVMVGTTRNEGSFVVAGIFPKLLQEPANLTIDSTKSDIEYIMDVYCKTGHGKDAANFYTESLVNPTEDELKITIATAWADLNLVCPTILFAEQLAQHAPTNRYYAYQLTQYPPNPLSPKWMGVQHGQDSIYIFVREALSRPEDIQLANDLIQALTSFAKSGSPGVMGSVQWNEAFDNQNGRGEPNTSHMSLNVDDYRMVDGFYWKACNQFWKQRIIQ